MLRMEVERIEEVEDRWERGKSRCCVCGRENGEGRARGKDIVRLMRCCYGGCVVGGSWVECWSDCSGQRQCRVRKLHSKQREEKEGRKSFEKGDRQ